MKLAKSHITLKTSTEQKITPEEEMKCNVKFKGQEKELTLQVVETPGPALFGRDGSLKFSWTGVKSKPLSSARHRKGSCNKKWISCCSSTRLYFLRLKAHLKATRLI